MTFTLREAVMPQDQAVLTRFMAGLCDLEHALHPGRQSGADGAEAHLLYLAREVAENNGLIILAETAPGSAAGMMICAVEDLGGHYLYPENRVVGFVYDLWIEPAHRGSALLDMLLDHAEAHFRSIGITLMMISHLAGNDRAAAAYRKRDFRPVEIMLERRIPPEET